MCFLRQLNFQGAFLLLLIAVQLALPAQVVFARSDIRLLARF